MAPLRTIHSGEWRPSWSTSETRSTVCLILYFVVFLCYTFPVVWQGLVWVWEFDLWIRS